MSTFDKTSERRAFWSNCIFTSTIESPRLLSTLFHGIAQTVVHHRANVARCLKGFPGSVLSHLTWDGPLHRLLALLGLCLPALPFLRGAQKGDLTRCSYFSVLGQIDVQISKLCVLDVFCFTSQSVFGVCWLDFVLGKI